MTSPRAQVIGRVALSWCSPLSVLLFAPACSSLSTVSPYENSSPAPLHAALSFTPPALDGAAYENSSLVIGFDSFPDPATVSYGNVTLRSGQLGFDAALRVDLAARAIVLTPARPLVPSVYELVVTSAVRSLDGRTLPQPATFTVTVQSGLAPSPSPSPTLTWANDIGPTLAKCSPSCHSPVNLAGLPQTPTRSLDLTGDPHDPVLGLINVESTGQAAIGRPMLRVAPYDSANSLLLRKLLGGEPPPGDRTAPYQEIGIVGQRMPLADDTMVSSFPLADDFIAQVERWIDEGAQ